MMLISKMGGCHRIPKGENEGFQVGTKIKIVMEVLNTFIYINILDRRDLIMWPNTYMI